MRRSSTPTHIHAGIFALLHRRPVVLRTRFHRDARWQELLSQNELSTRQTSVVGLQAITDVDWAAVEARRESLRIESLAFLRAALDSSVGAGRDRAAERASRSRVFAP